MKRFAIAALLMAVVGCGTKAAPDPCAAALEPYLRLVGKQVGDGRTSYDRLRNGSVPASAALTERLAFARTHFMDACRQVPAAQVSCLADLQQMRRAPACQQAQQQLDAALARAQRDEAAAPSPSAVPESARP